MTGEVGQIALCLALALALVEGATGLLGAQPQGGSARGIAHGAAMGVLVFVAVAFGALVLAFVTSDFSVLDVASNSHTEKPLLYKITGAWGNHEGSMLLWVLVLALYSGAIGFARAGSARLTSAALGVMGLLAAAFLLFILLTSNPFERLDPPPFEGAGLNPLLQDPGLAFHPPMLYAGYVGLSAAFAFAAAGLITGEADAAWARAARPFILAAWMALTLGITLGSWWAYYELGWGGFWFWDPVENASLMPWLAATALLHSALATERTGAFRIWTLLLAIAAFSLSLIGTFLVRSGIITSVHSFASDPTRGVFILAMLAAAIGGALALFAWRAPQLEGGTRFEPVSRETALLVNNVFLSAAVATVFLGTLYPLILDALTGTKISVGPPYFALTFAPIFVGLMLALPFGPRLGWKRGDLRAALLFLRPGLGLAALAFVVVLAFVVPRTLAGAASFALGGWVIGASVLEYRARRHALSAAMLAVVLAHAGLGVTLIGIAGVSLWRSEALEVLGPGDRMTVGGYTLRLDGVDKVAGPNYDASRARVTVLDGDREIAQMNPEQRLFATQGQQTAETAIRTTGFSDLYLALGDDRGGGRWTLRAYVNPFAPFIWFGGIIMALGGLCSLVARVVKRSVPAPAEAAAVVP
jgi:cytochrome c-type biogenesis protein CcmF